MSFFGYIKYRNLWANPIRCEENYTISNVVLNLKLVAFISFQCIPNIPQNKITEKLGIPTRKVTYIMLEC